MIIYWSMLLWVPFIYIIYSVNRKGKEAKAAVPSLAETPLEPPKTEKIPLSYAIAIFAYFTFWIGMRG